MGGAGNPKRKRDSSPTSESSCGAFAAANPWILGNFSAGELQNHCSTNSTASYRQQGWGPWQQRWRRAWGCCGRSGGSAPCGVPRKGAVGWRVTLQARQGVETGGWGRCRRWRGCRSEEEAWEGNRDTPSLTATWSGYSHPPHFSLPPHRLRPRGRISSAWWEKPPLLAYTEPEASASFLQTCIDIALNTYLCKVAHPSWAAVKRGMSCFWQCLHV